MRLELTLPALERMLGGDTEIEVGLRQQIVEEFSRKHIKALVNDTTLKQLHERWRAECDAEIKRITDGYLAQHVPSHQTTLGYKVADLVRKTAEPLVEKMVQERLTQLSSWVDARVKNYLADALKIEVAAQVKKAVEEQVMACTDHRLGELVDEEIKRRLELAKSLNRESRVLIG